MMIQYKPKKYFFHWRYSPLWALACRTIPLHLSLSVTNSLHLLTPSTWRSLSTSYVTLYTVLQELEDSLQLPKYILSPCPSNIIKSFQLIPLLNFRNNTFFYCVGVLNPTPNSQPGGPVYTLLSGSSPLTCLVWEAPPVAYATASITLRIMWPHKPHHYVKVGALSRGKEIHISKLIF
jgi:hypothetical protein